MVRNRTFVIAPDWFLIGLAAAFVLLLRYVYTVVWFSYLGTEDNYASLVFAETVIRTANLVNHLGEIEPRIADFPPLIPLLVAILAKLSGAPAKLFFLLLPVALQLFSAVLIYWIIREIARNRLISLLGTLVFLSNYRYLWVSSLSLIDSVAIYVLLVATLAYVKFWKTKRLAYLYVSFLLAGTLSLAHNYGNVFIAILALSYAIGILVELRQRWKLLGPLTFGFLLWLASAYQPFIKAAAVYLPAVKYSVVQSPTNLGFSFLEVLPDFYPTLLLYLFLPLGYLALLLGWKGREAGLIFLVWAPLNLAVLMLVPESYSHYSRYPLQLLTPFTVLGIIGIGMVLRFSGWRHVRVVVLASLVLLLLSPSSAHLSSVQKWKGYVSSSYGVREAMGEFMRYRGMTKVLYPFWPSVLHAYNQVPTDTLVDYQAMIQNSENPAQAVMEGKVSFFIWDKLSGYYYPFPDKTRELLQTQLIELREVRAFGSKATVYAVVKKEGVRRHSLDAASPALDPKGFSELKYYEQAEDAHGLIKEQRLPYRAMTADGGQVSLPLPSPAVKEGVLYLALKVTLETQAEVNVTGAGENLATVSIGGQNLKGWEWWFDYYGIDLKRIPPEARELTITINKNPEGEVALHKVELLYR